VLLMLSAGAVTATSVVPASGGFNAISGSGAEIAAIGPAPRAGGSVVTTATAAATAAAATAAAADG
jgi:hypothetical protein